MSLINYDIMQHPVLLYKLLNDRCTDNTFFEVFDLDMHEMAPKSKEFSDDLKNSN